MLRRVAVARRSSRAATAGSSTATTRRSTTTRNVEPLTPTALANWRDGGRARARLAARARHRATSSRSRRTSTRSTPRRCRRRSRALGDVSRTDQLFTALQDTGVAVDVRPALFEAKARERIYQQTDTHWNDRGALVAYQQIIEAVRARVPATPPAWTRDDFDAGRRATSRRSIWPAMMGLKRVLREADLRAACRRRAAPRARRRAGRRDADRRSGTAGHRDRRIRRCRAR